MKFLVLTSGTLLLLLSTHSQYAQNMHDMLDPLATQKGESKFFRHYNERLFQEDEFLDEISKDEKEAQPLYYRVFFNAQAKPQTLGFYSAQMDEDLGIKITRISQQVNKDQIPYFTINYTYNPDNENLVSSKTLKDNAGRIVGSYYYHWNTETEKLKKVERYGATEYLYQMELKGYITVTWKGELPSIITSFNKMKLPIEKYTFTDTFKLDNTLTTDIPEYAIGNENIFIGHLKRYDRFKPGSTSKASYYIEFQSGEGSSFLEQKFSGDGILFQEKLHRQIPQNS